jgi:hypothetical protein
MKKYYLLICILFLMISNLSIAAQKCVLDEAMPGTFNKDIANADDVLKNKDIYEKIQENNNSIDMMLSSDQLSNKSNYYISVLIEGVDTDAMHNVSREGPVVSLNPDGTERCIAKMEEDNILLPPFYMAKNRYLYMQSGLTNGSQMIAIDLTNCNIVWRSKDIPDSFGVNPKYKNGYIVAGSKIKYKIEDNCLPK